MLAIIVRSYYRQILNNRKQKIKRQKLNIWPDITSDIQGMVWGEPEREQVVSMSSVNCGWTLAAALHCLSPLSFSTRQPSYVPLLHWAVSTVRLVLSCLLVCYRTMNSRQYSSGNGHQSCGNDRQHYNTAQRTYVPPYIYWPMDYSPMWGSLRLTPMIRCLLPRTHAQGVK